MSAGPAALFDFDPAPAPEEQVSGARAGQFDPAAWDAALSGDGYGWLAGLLPEPTAPACERCARPMRLPVAAPVLWACPACHPEEAA